MDIKEKLKLLNANSWYGAHPERRNILVGANRICIRCEKQINPLKSGIKEIKVSEVSTIVSGEICRVYLCDVCWFKLNKWLLNKEDNK